MPYGDLNNQEKYAYHAAEIARHRQCQRALDMVAHSETAEEKTAQRAKLVTLLQIQIRPDDFITPVEPPQGIAPK